MTVATPDRIPPSLMPRPALANDDDTTFLNDLYFLFLSLIWPAELRENLAVAQSTNIISKPAVSHVVSLTGKHRVRMREFSFAAPIQRATQSSVGRGLR